MPLANTEALGTLCCVYTKRILERTLVTGLHCPLRGSCSGQNQEQLSDSWASRLFYFVDIVKCATTNALFTSAVQRARVESVPPPAHQLTEAWRCPFCTLTSVLALSPFPNLTLSSLLFFTYFLVMLYIFILWDSLDPFFGTRRNVNKYICTYRRIEFH